MAGWIRPRAARPALPGRASATPRSYSCGKLLQGVKHYKRREQRPSIGIIQRNILRRQRQNLVQASAGVPERVDQQALLQVRLMGQLAGHLGRQQVARRRGFAARPPRRSRSRAPPPARVSGTDRAVRILFSFAGQIAQFFIIRIFRDKQNFRSSVKKNRPQ